jgi:hypothetical protein
MASRRNPTDESGVSFTSSMVQDAGIAFQYLKATELEANPSETVLRRSLTIRSVISTTSSFATRYQQALGNPALQTTREIGRGLQATIFEQVGHELVVKKEHVDNARTAKNLKNEFASHHLVYDSFQRYGPPLDCKISIPRPIALATSDEGHTYKSINERLPKEHQTSSDLVQMERVLPLPKVIRRALIEKFYPFEGGNAVIDPATVQNVLNDLPNKHCLVRPYLGMRNKTYPREQFSLRNFILSLQSLTELNFDVQQLATTLGRAYAIMQWGAHVDGDDVEFVLGSSTTVGPHSAGATSVQHRKIGLHMIDFGQCEKVDMSSDAQVVYQAFKGAMVTGDNAYFIPNYRHTPGLFQEFCNAYAQAAKVIIQDQGLADKFDISEFMAQYKEYVEDFM